MSLVAQAALLVSFPVLASIIGSVVAAVKPPGRTVVSGVQHFAAGVVLAALVGEIMPELRAEGHLFWTVVGFVAGAMLVLALGAYGRHTEEEAEEARFAAAALNGEPTPTGEIAGEGASAAEAAGVASTATATATADAAKGRVRATAARAVAVSLPIGMLAAVVIDLLLDGVLVGLGVRLGSTQGLILTIALTLEILFLALSVAAELTDGGLSKGKSILVCTGLGLCTAIGAIGGVLLLGNASTTVMSGVLAFGAAALLYLVVEELLVEAHEERETVLLGAMFFLGFIVIYVLAALGG